MTDEPAGADTVLRKVSEQMEAAGIAPKTDIGCAILQVAIAADGRPLPKPDFLTFVAEQATAEFVSLREQLREAEDVIDATAGNVYKIGLGHRDEIRRLSGALREARTWLGRIRSWSDVASLEVNVNEAEAVIVRALAEREVSDG